MTIARRPADQESRQPIRLFRPAAPDGTGNRSWIDHRGDRIHMASVPLTDRARSQALIGEGWSVMRLDDCYQCYRVDPGGADAVRT